MVFSKTGENVRRNKTFRLKRVFFPVGFFQHLCRKEKLVSLSVFRVIDFHEKKIGILVFLSSGGVPCLLYLEEHFEVIS